MPDENDESGFVVRDRRRFNSDAPAAAAETTPPPIPTESLSPAPLPDLNAAFAAAGTADVSDEEMEAFLAENGDESGYGAEEDGALPDVYSILALFLGELRNLSLIRLGLVPNPVSGQSERDLPQARVAIDTVAFLAGQLDAVVSPDEQLPLKALVSELQMQYVEQIKRG